MMPGYERDGFLVRERLIDEASCDALVSRANEIVRDFEPDTVSIFTTREQARNTDPYFLESGDKIRCFFEEEAFAADGTLQQPKERSINKIGHALHDLDPVFSRFSRDPRIVALAGSLGLGDAALVQSMYIFKQPLIGGEVTVHQDHTFLWADPPVTGLWFALEDATKENGCLWVLPGGHRTEPVRRRYHRTAEGDTAFEVLDERPLPTTDMVPLEVPKGSCIVLHGLLPHRSSPNRSPRSRHAYTLHLLAMGARYAPDNWLQRAP